MERDSDSVQPEEVTPAPEAVVVPVPTASASSAFVEITLDDAPAPGEDIRLSAAQYVQVRGYRWQRAAGFLHEMREKFPGNRTRPEWDKLWEAFLGRPVG